ncbi:hypothetical protein IJI72_02415 [Candidatus Saccharibacteria bacterium]|nr:hypothetical protein [Candidatus Saccharibacteria bacterium]
METSQIVSQEHVPILNRLRHVEDDIAEVRRLCGWPDHAAREPRFVYGKTAFHIRHISGVREYTSASVEPLELQVEYMLELAQELRDNLELLQTLVEKSLDPLLLTAADAHLEVRRGKLFTLLLTPNNPAALQTPDRETIHWLAQHELAGDYDYLTCVYLQNSEALSVPLPKLALKIAQEFNEVMTENLTP